LFFRKLPINTYKNLPFNGIIAIVATIEKIAPLSLEAFLAFPETQPASEYANGIIKQKPMPKGKHSTIQFELASAINQQAKPTNWLMPYQIYLLRESYRC